MDKKPSDNEAIYKAGRTDDAVRWEDKRLQIVTAKKSKWDIEFFNNTIQEMKSRKQIWLEKRP